ncbi:MAG: 1-deoxy-D-xylulose-5-phosphate synthase [Chloroflexi bacterium]|nr:1-deoxy-D-xylulose-5-phosphate synthase [Chloroflexota bacterium]
MRAAFFRALADLAARDDRVVLLTGDLGFMAAEGFRERFPARFFNVGVAEQNMVGLATGLADAGLIPFCYSIVTFATLRPYEFIRNGPVHHGLPVRIVGMGGGLEYGLAGPSHHGLEDIAIMRALPGMSVFAPADAAQAETAVAATAAVPGPLYLRLGKDDRTIVPGLEGRFAIGRLQTIARGSDAAILAMGGIAPVAADVARALGHLGVSATVAVVASIVPPPLDDLVAVLRDHPLVVTLEAHGPVGGLGSLVAEAASTMARHGRLERCAVGPSANSTTGSQRFLEARAGLSMDRLVARIIAVQESAA